MNPGEVVYLIREPDNPYDTNAIKVVNLQHKQVGHIEASTYGTAGALSLITDYKLPGKAGGELEAVVGYGKSFSSECWITIIGTMNHYPVIKEHINRKRLPHLNVITGESFYDFKPAKLTAIQQEEMSFNPTKSQPLNYQKLSEEDLIEQLDNIWDTQDKNQNSISLHQKYESIINNNLAHGSLLFEHQKQGIAWMLQKELSDDLPPFYKQIKSKGLTFYNHSLLRHDYADPPAISRGGILCYDMGLGKSLMMLALILCNRPNNSQIVSSPTLIVCPLSVISSWEDQITSHLKVNSVKVFTYYGKNRLGEGQEEDFINSHDIVITTYETLVSEIDVNKSNDTSTNNITTSHKKSKKYDHRSMLLRIHWHRIVLDESHIIRNMKTLKFKACTSIQSTYRWCLTGTPILNTVKDIHSSVQFLRLEPFVSDNKLYDRYFTREIEGKHWNEEGIVRLRTLVKHIALRRDKKTILNHNIPVKSEIIVRVTLSPEERDAYNAIYEAIRHFVHDINVLHHGLADDLNGLMQNTSTILGLITRLRQCCLDFSLVPPQALVDLLSVFKRTKETNSIDKDPNLIIQRLSKEVQTELLQRLQSVFAKAIGTSIETLPSTHEIVDSGEGQLECCVCLNELSEDDTMIFVNCMHTMCGRCVDEMFSKKTANVPCPLCRRTIARNDCIYYKTLKSNHEKSLNQSSDKQQTTLPNINRSAKTIEILKAIESILSKSVDEKIVIFCSFTGYLNVLEKEFHSLNYQTCRIDGNVNQIKRSDEIKRFTNNDNYKIMLCSVRAAGVGITLTRANHVFLADLWWSPAIDLQAIDRVHRLGQQRPVQVLRFLVNDSIDERIYELQKSKMETARQALEKDNQKKAKERVKDLKKLLNI
eukprot:gene17510-23071_t